MSSPTATIPNYVLHYFAGRGVVETTRYLFAIANIPYTDERFPINLGTPGDFSTVIRTEWEEAKASGKFIKCQNVLPALSIDGSPLVGESKAIERYVATIAGLMGSTPLEGLQIDCAMEGVRGLKDSYQKARGIKDPDEKEKAMDKYFFEELPSKCKSIEASLPSEFATSSINAADVTWYYAFHFFWDRKEDALKATEECPTIQAMMEKVKGNERAMQWEKDRPQSMF